MANGFNPMRWDCSKRGCFNVKRRPKIEVFHDCLPGRISFGDIDGIVEVCGRGLILEWKSDRCDLPTGQKIMYQRLTKSKLLSVIVICGNAETMEVQSAAKIYAGVIYDFEECDLEGVKSLIRSWVLKAQKAKAPPNRTTANLSFSDN